MPTPSQAKIDPEDGKKTTEHISEHLAHQLGEILGIPTATVNVGFRDERIGSMSYLVRKNDEALCEGMQGMTIVLTIRQVNPKRLC